MRSSRPGIPAPHLAAYLDDGLSSDELKSLMEHHRDICLECEEELQLLRKALGR